MNGIVLASTTFVASAVEFVEAATIVLAVGYAQGWRAAFLGTVWACAALVAIVAAFGPLLAAAASLRRIELVVGPFLVLFGIAWLRKAVWRFAGRKASHDELAIYAREVERLQTGREHRNGVAVAFGGVFVEGLEVAVIVVSFGAASLTALAWSFGGAGAALAIVTAAAVAVRKPFARVPENAMKAVVGVMLLSLGTMWTGDGIGVAWWSGDGTLFAIAATYACAAAALVLVLRVKRVRA
ncbi:MAG TPA: hypothetical protein VMF61_12235 [Candidatus Acidoferrales bacterium]|nr:hypothetical protein [Candidatus Acidoferrales bacterium]